MPGIQSIINGKRGGRPLSQATLITTKIREKMAKKLEERFGPIIDAQLDAALGIQTEAYDKKTNKLYYKDPGPNVVAFKTILDQVIGRAKESLEITGDEDKPVLIQVSSAIKRIYADPGTNSD